MQDYIDLCIDVQELEHTLKTTSPSQFKKNRSPIPKEQSVIQANDFKGFIEQLTKQRLDSKKKITPFETIQKYSQLSNYQILPEPNCEKTFDELRKEIEKIPLNGLSEHIYNNIRIWYISCIDSPFALDKLKPDCMRYMSYCVTTCSVGFETQADHTCQHLHKFCYENANVDQDQIDVAPIAPEVDPFAQFKEVRNKPTLPTDIKMAYDYCKSMYYNLVYNPTVIDVGVFYDLCKNNDFYKKLDEHNCQPIIANCQADHDSFCQTQDGSPFIEKCPAVPLTYGFCERMYGYFKKNPDPTNANVVVMNCLTVHKGLQNLSPACRTGLAECALQGLCQLGSVICPEKLPKLMLKGKKARSRIQQTKERTKEFEQRMTTLPYLSEQETSQLDQTVRECVEKFRTCALHDDTISCMNFAQSDCDIGAFVYSAKLDAACTDPIKRCKNNLQEPTNIHRSNSQVGDYVGACVCQQKSFNVVAASLEECEQACKLPPGSTKITKCRKHNGPKQPKQSVTCLPDICGGFGHGNCTQFIRHTFLPSGGAPMTLKENCDVVLNNFISKPNTVDCKFFQDNCKHSKYFKTENKKNNSVECIEA